jgi:glutathione S-transferase
MRHLRVPAYARPGANTRDGAGPHLVPVLLHNGAMPPQFVDLETARAARGLRVVVAGTIPSPWSEGAKALFHVKRLPFVAVRFRRDGEAALAAATGARNVPVVLYDDEPPRTGWAEILALAERLGGAVPLVPEDPERRILLHGFIHELLGEGGLAWSSRLVMIHGGLSSQGAVGFPLPVAQFLAPRYGYAPERIPPAMVRIRQLVTLFDQRLDGARYLLGDQLTALDLYLATSLTPVLGVSEADCPAALPGARAAFAYLREQVGPLPASLLSHRAAIFERHLEWPIPL